MKYIFFFSILFILISCLGETDKGHVAKSEKNKTSQLCIADSLRDGANGGYLEFETNKYDFGTVKITHTPKITFDFNFKNSGNIPVIIAKADVSCGCVTAKHPEKPVMPGEEGSIKVVVNTENQRGFFDKTIIVKSNGINQYILLRILGSLN